MSETKKALSLNIEDRGQMFAGVATIRAAILDVLDNGWTCLSTNCGMKHPFHFDPNDEGMEEESVRYNFAGLVIARIAELQNPPHDGINLSNLCDKHKRLVLPRPTVNVCVACEAERGR